MKFSRIFLNRLQNHPGALDTVVVIDVLRSFTTAAVALSRGASAIYPVEGITAAVALAAQLPNPVTVGAVGGGDPVPGFDFGNSPSRISQAELSGRPVVMSTAAGVRGLQRFHQARHLYAASLVCARATVAAIQSSRARDICFVITGEWVDRDGDEDIACADYMEALLQGQDASPKTFARRVRDSDFGRRFQSGTWPHLPIDDLALATRVDCFDFAMQVERDNGHLLIR